MSEESKSVYMPYYELVRISLDAAQRIGSEIELHHGGLIKLFKEIDALNARIAELEAAQRWIPVSERLPEEDTDGNTLMAICRHSGEWVRAPFGAEFADEFVRHYSYWMYAPQPPEVQE